MPLTDGQLDLAKALFKRMNELQKINMPERNIMITATAHMVRLRRGGLFRQKNQPDQYEMTIRIATP
ncbi:MAG: hypothetical protein ABIE07_13665 [Candidatus Zixiibacteriota bacterium]